MKMTRQSLTASLIILLMSASFAGSAEVKPTKRALIVCGLPGDEDYREQFVSSIVQIRQALTSQYGFQTDNVRVQFGSIQDEPAPEDLAINGHATAKEIAAEAKRLIQSTKPQDTAWVFVFGQSYFDGKNVFLNIPEADLNHHQFAKLFNKLSGGQITFFVGVPASGFFIKDLSQPGRIIITSTEAGAETNGSIFHTSLANSLQTMTAGPDSDLDGDGRVSLRDLYIKTNQHLANAYLTNSPPLIPTEHPQLDDDGDGHGSELQIDYLTIAQGGRADSKRKRRFRVFKDGNHAAKTLLPFVAKQGDE